MGWQVCPEPTAAAHRAFTGATECSALSGASANAFNPIETKKVRFWITSVNRIRVPKPSLLNHSLTQLHELMENGKKSLRLAYISI